MPPKHLALAILLFAFIACSGNDTPCLPCEAQPSSSSSATPSSSSVFVDDGTYAEHGGKAYKTVEIGEQVWFAENLNYYAEGSRSRCYNDNPGNCVKYGRLYDWAETMALPNVCNSCYKPELCKYSQSLCEWLNSQTPLDEYCENNTCQVNEPHQGICPDGWHIPGNADWDKLFRFVDSENNGNGRETKEYYQSDTAGKYLKATGYWSPSDNTENLDTYGFSALPGGFSTSGGSGDVGIYGFWWSATETSAGMSDVNMMFNNNSDAYWFTANKTNMYSVRCVKD